MALCNILAFWCRKDEQLMDKMFRASGLMREKWNRKNQWHNLRRGHNLKSGPGMQRDLRAKTGIFTASVGHHKTAREKARKTIYIR